MANEVMNKTGNKSQEFFEFVLPPVDMHLQDNTLIITIDIPGFKKEDIKTTIAGNILSINAEKKESESNNEVISKQRPSIIDKKIRLPIRVLEGQVSNFSEFSEGVLIIKIPINSNGNHLSLEKK